jgi:hypothetical protein
VDSFILDLRLATRFLLVLHFDLMLINVFLFYKLVMKLKIKYCNSERKKKDLRMKILKKKNIMGVVNCYGDQSNPSTIFYIYDII